MGHDSSEEKRNGSSVERRSDSSVDYGIQFVEMKLGRSEKLIEIVDDKTEGSDNLFVESAAVGNTVDYVSWGKTSLDSAECNVGKENLAQNSDNSDMY
jgi:hypothetical protein